MTVEYKKHRRTPPNFPYTDPTTCYFVIDPEDGQARPIKVDRSTVKLLSDTDPTVYAVWPGRVHASDMFVIDKIQLFKAFL